MIAKAEKTSKEKYSIYILNISFKFIFPLLAIVLILVLCLGLYLSIKKSGLGSSDAAGWMQAIGAIFAIAGSFFIASNQAKENIKSIIKSQELAAKAKRNGILSVVAAAKLHIANIDAVIPEDVPVQIYNVYDITMINGVVEALSTAPLYEIESPEAIAALLSLKDQFVFLGRQVEEYLAGPWRHKHMASTLEGLREPQYKSNLEKALVTSKKVLTNNVKQRIQYINQKIKIIETNLASE